MAQIKTIGSNGQILLGEEFASESVLNEQWLHQKDNATKLDEALNWAANNPPEETDLTELESKLSLHTDHDSAYK